MPSGAPHRLGISGRIARTFQDNPLTPILALLGLLLGMVALMVTPREEEPQIDVTMANVIVPFPGADARQVEQMVSYPLEQTLSEIEQIKHTYSISRPGMAVLTVEFEVGVKRQPALVRLYDKVYSNQDWMPRGLGIGQPIIKPKGIDDVPVMALTLWTDDPQRSAVELAEVAHTLENELKRIPGTRDVYTIGAPERAVMVTLDPARLASHGLAVADLAGALQTANLARQAGERIGPDGVVQVTSGQFLADRDDVASLVLGVAGGQPVRLQDVAMVTDAADTPASYVWHGAPAGRDGPATGIAPAVTLAIAKKPGSNASDITQAVQQRIEALRGQVIPDGIEIEVTRDYGLTASDKAQTLMKKLVFATGLVILLVLFALGRREAVVIGSAVILTLSVTLFASLAMGFTLNRVSLFALIFSIGILVDDAIVVVENIHRHMSQGGKSLREAIPPAVDEVGGPTILATFTVIAALMPMAFVTGLMGPYMRPIPVNASVGMLLSLMIALVVTPWLSLKLLRHHAGADDHAGDAADGNHGHAPGTMAARLHRLFERVMTPFLDRDSGNKRRRLLFLGMVGLVLLACSLAVFKLVVLKMLPFDNKSEFQVVVDLPEGRTLEDTNALLTELAAVLDRTPEVLDYQGYAGSAAPINFNGLVRQYYLREGANVGDLQVNLVDRHERSRKSHEIASDLRPQLAGIGRRHDASVKVVEVPPGPPVLSPIVAELYGPDYARSRELGRALEQRFLATEGIVDVDTSVEADAARDVLAIDRVRAARLGVAQSDIADAIAAGLSGMDASHLVDGSSKYPRPIRLRLPPADQDTLDDLLSLRVRGGSGQLVPLSELVQVRKAGWDGAIQHKDLLPVVYVMGDESSRIDSPLYGMFDLVGQVSDNAIGGQALQQFFIRQPPETDSFAIKWDGEWQITYETFRDMGIAYAAGMILIYLLVVAYFRNYVVPLVIMAPIPLTVIGVMPGHALLGAQFTATSMIGMIALAGIIVRNSILLVDFINHLVERGQSLESAVVDACAVRAQPIALTALAAMGGAFFILDDPIFNGLAISLIFGILVSTVLTLVVIPLLYYGLLKRKRARQDTQEAIA
ncbi:multidrug transporter AcrB [Pseudoxanthomonas kalamensis DSM 18571]|uniref:efflux RND transporter permease subunit n=1 Tax=Pseudoxanthomonas kalamensis TaxID=289483 RepID=UPI001391CA59|nr:efflux RND transporter permease subunit [Pseudoxanthomonas kalamensis]KAF1711375.1 multidrug transporter AcrB [Pseudoxanthomonas kalamensis DSM 18571]